jgi:hypothetical protein
MLENEPAKWAGHFKDWTGMSLQEGLKRGEDYYALSLASWSKLL